MENNRYYNITERKIINLVKLYRTQKNIPIYFVLSEQLRLD